METTEPSFIADPERALVLAYAPARSRPALGALWRLDERLGRIVATSREPMVAAISLAWWREALEALDHAPPPAEPLLQSIAETLLPYGVMGAELAAIEEGWAALLSGDPPDEEAIRDHGRLRGRPLFGLAGRLLAGVERPETAIAGEGWALADLAVRLGDTAGAVFARARAAECLGELDGYRWPVPLRPLGALAKLAYRDALFPHKRRQGAPARVSRMMLHRLTGR
jgi:phytoene synthase